MKYIIFALISMFSVSVFAQICDDNSKLGPLADFGGTNCFTDEITHEDLEIFAVQKDQIVPFCQKCQNIPVEKILDNADAQKETRAIYGKTILNEFQKELSEVSINLMRMRSSYGLELNSKSLAESCNIEKHLKKPSCLTKEEFKAQTLPIKNSLATELADIITGNQKPKNGLFTKRANKCGLKDSDALYSHMRYAESLLSPQLISELKSLNLKNGSLTDEAIAGKLSNENIAAIGQLKLHPIIGNLFKDSTALNKFLKEASKVLPSQNPENDNSKIVELVYQGSPAKKFGQDLEKKCSTMFTKTSEHLEDVLCDQKKRIAADDLRSLEAVSNNRFFSMTPEKAESEMKIHCSILNSNKDKKYISLSKLINDIHGESGNLIQVPLSLYKEQSYTDSFENVANNICDAKTKSPPCSSDSKEQMCLLLKFYNLSKTSKLHQDMASQSDDNINLILRSLVGDGLPMKDGKLDHDAYVVLQNERILAGGTQSEAPQRKATASEFHEAVRRSSSSSSFATTKPNMPTPQMNPGQVPQNNAINNNGYSSDTNSEDNGGQQNNGSQNTKSISKNFQNPTFSSLSDQEQQDILNRLKKSAGKNKKTNDNTISNDDPSYGENPQTVTGPTTFTTTSENANQNNDSRFVNPKLGNNFSGKKVNLDPVKQQSAVNNALIDANVNRSIAGSSSGVSSAPTLSVSKSSKDENEIKIQVEEQELSKISEFKEKLKKLLADHSKDISVVEDGEKIIVKLNDYKIDVHFNESKGFYEVLPLSGKVPEEYLNTISYYFNVTLKDKGGKRDALVETLPKIKK